MANVKIPSLLCLLVLLLSLSACEDRAGSAPSKAQGGAGAGRVDFPGTPEGARQLLLQFLQPGTDKEALTQKLRPNSKDIHSVFKKDVVKAVKKGYAKPWDEGKIVIRGHPGETELLVWSATTEELQKQSGDAGAFPGGYAKAAPYFNPGISFYRFKFVRPGEQLGFAWDGLVFVNGHWVFFPKPWRVVP